ncbi:MAG: NADH-quinone oxidoreductase subunit A [Anaerolineae bacterium]
MAGQYIAVAILGAVALAFSLLVLAATFVVGPRNPSPVKETPYESGVVPVGPGRRRTPVRFYLTATLFILFDVEVIYVFPWAVGLRDLARPAPAGIGFAAVGVMAAFIAVLALGLVFVWRKGALDWRLPYPGGAAAPSAGTAPAPPRPGAIGSQPGPGSVSP